MEQIKSIIEFFQNMTKEKIIDIAIAIMIILIFCLLSSLLSYLVIKLFRIKEKDKKKIKENAFFKPLKACFITLGIYFAILILRLPQDVMNVCYKLYKITIICIFANGLANFFNPNSRMMKTIGESNKIQGNKTLTIFIGKVGKAIIYVIAGFLVITELGYNLNGLVAGLGLGGVVVALAAQDIAKNLFGGLAIIIDKPFVVGDWIKVGEYEGTVVDITFRSTRIKTVEDTIVNIQNSTLANDSITNFAKMEKRRYSFNLKLPLNTNTDTVDTIITRIKFVLGHEKNVLKDSIIVECNSILNDGINILVALYTNIIPYNDYLTFRTKINQDILNIIEAENIKLSYPAQDIYVHQGKEKN